MANANRTVLQDALEKAYKKQARDLARRNVLMAKLLAEEWDPSKLAEDDEAKEAYAQATIRAGIPGALTYEDESERRLMVEGLLRDAGLPGRYVETFTRMGVNVEAEELRDWYRKTKAEQITNRLRLKLDVDAGPAMAALNNLSECLRRFGKVDNLRVAYAPPFSPPRQATDVFDDLYEQLKQMKKEDAEKAEPSRASAGDFPDHAGFSCGGKVRFRDPDDGLAALAVAKAEKRAREAQEQCEVLEKALVESRLLNEKLRTEICMLKVDQYPQDLGDQAQLAESALSTALCRLGIIKQQLSTLGEYDWETDDMGLHGHFKRIVDLLDVTTIRIKNIRKAAAQKEDV